jgi:pimeloyl-ACP methyl ester carboxylesterase
MSNRPVNRRLTTVAIVIAVFAVAGCNTAPEPQPIDRATMSERELLVSQAPYDNSSFVVVDGIVVHYRTWLPAGGSGRPVLLVHGLGASTFSYREISSWLAQQGYTVVAVDVPPFGYSDRRERAIEADRVDLFWSVLDRFREIPSVRRAVVGREWTLIGHSLGGRIAAGMAIRRPEQVSSVVLMAPALQFAETRTSIPFVTTDPVSRFMEASLRQIGSPESLATVLANAYGTMPPDEAIQGYYEPLTVPGTISAVVRFSSGALQEIGPLDQIVAPTLIVWGNEDTWVPIGTGYRAAQRIPNVIMVVVPGAAHIPMETDPEPVRRAIKLFLDDQRGFGPGS